MVNRKFTTSPKDIDKLPNSRTERRHSSDLHRSKLGPEDDVISSLAGAYENVRARQVGEWESSQRAAFGRSA